VDLRPGVIASEATAHDSSFRIENLLVVISRISFRFYKVGIIYTAGVTELVMPWTLRNFVPKVGP
jgi:hypothetical protein